jgi:hypothetical protein
MSFGYLGHERLDSAQLALGQGGAAVESKVLNKVRRPPKRAATYTCKRLPHTPLMDLSPPCRWSSSCLCASFQRTALVSSSVAPVHRHGNIGTTSGYQHAWPSNSSVPAFGPGVFSSLRTNAVRRFGSLPCAQSCRCPVLLSL